MRSTPLDPCRRCASAEGPEPLLALFLLHLREAFSFVVEFLEAAAINLQQTLEAGHQIIISSHRVELGIVDAFGKPIVVFRFAAPLRLQRRVFLVADLTRR